jgi:hypothetical protein
MADHSDETNKNNNLTKPLVPIDANVDQSGRNNKNSNLTKPLVPYGGS